MMFNSQYDTPYAPPVASHAPGYVPLGQESQYDAPEKTPEQKAKEGYEAAAPDCNCGTKAKAFQVMKEGINKGRWFYVCEKPRGNGSCDFFKWISQQGSVVQGGVRNNTLVDMITANQTRLLNELQIMQRKMDTLLNFCNPNH